MRLLSLLTILSAAMVGAGCDFSQTDDPLTAVRRAHDGDVIRLDKATGFDWDRLYVFGPYAGPEVIRDALGFDWDSSKIDDIEERDDITLLVFVRDGEVVESIRHSLNDGNFTCLDSVQIRPGGVPASESRVRVHVFRDQPGEPLRRVVVLADPTGGVARRTARCLKFS